MSKKEPKPTRKFIDESILGFDWLLQYGGTKQSAIEWFAKKYKKEVDPERFTNTAWGSFITHTSVTYAGAIWVERGRGTSTISHEVAHAVLYMFEVLNVKPKEAEEIFARYTGWLNREIADLYTKMYARKIKKKKNK